MTLALIGRTLVDDVATGMSCGQRTAAARPLEHAGPVPTELRLPRVFDLDLLMRRGLSPTQVRTRVQRREFLRLRRGAYCRARDWDVAGPEERHALEAAAYALTHDASAPFAFSHGTAAALHELPVATEHLEVLHLTVDPTSRLTTRRDAEVDRQVARLPVAEVRRHRGVRVTSPARTVVDCLRRLPTRDAVAVADAALRQRLCSTAEVEAVLASQSDWPFAVVAAQALALVDPRRESALESRSAVVMHEHKVPTPEPQMSIHDARGRFVARVDFAWLAFGVVGEVDGRVKYLDGAAHVIEAEKDRQARLEALGLVVVRWDVRHLYGAEPVLVQRVMAALARGDGRRFRGRAA